MNNIDLNSGTRGRIAAIAAGVVAVVSIVVVVGVILLAAVAEDAVVHGPAHVTHRASR